jgi:hypothetical protein
MSFDQVAQDALEKLKNQSFQELSELPAQSQEELWVNDRRVTLCVWVDRVNSKELMVVVQLYDPGILGCGTMLADGFVIAHDGGIRKLSEREWMDFS